MTRPPLLDMAFGYMPAQILYVAAELRLADKLATGSRTGAELAAETETDPAALHRLLRALAWLGVVEQKGRERFELTTMGEGLRSDVPGSFHGLVLLFTAPEVWKTWGDLLSSVRTGEPTWERVTGATSFEYFEANPELSKVFNAAMAQHTRDVAPALIEAYDFARFGTVADLGGGDGTLLAAILNAAPGPRGVLYDLPAGLASAAEVLKDAGVADRCEIVAGDFFESVPEGADAYVLKSVIHDWDDEKAAAILRNVRRTMPAHAKVLVLEMVFPEVVTPETAGVGSDINMLVATGGRERTAKEYAELFAAAGLSLTAMTDPVPSSAYRVMEGGAAG